jgi:hypothetical protein
MKIRYGGLFLKGLGLDEEMAGIKGYTNFVATIMERLRGALLRLIDLVTLNAINIVGSDLNINRFKVAPPTVTASSRRTMP